MTARRSLRVGRPVPAVALAMAMALSSACTADVEGLNADTVATTLLAADGTAEVEAVAEGLNDLEPGVCYDEPAETSGRTEGELAAVAVVPCEQQHDFEVYHVGNLDGGTYPGEAELQDQVSSECTDRFAAFAGISYEESKLDYAFYYPGDDAWSESDRSYVCSVFDVAGNKLQGSMAGAGY